MQKQKSIKRENSKKEKAKLNAHSGITLIALVITIIVLLILAGVALSMLTGDSGILNNAENAKENTLEANAKEKVQIAIMEHKIGQYSEGKTLKEYLEAAGATDVSETGKEGKMDGYNFKIEDGVVTLTKGTSKNPDPVTSNLTEAEQAALAAENEKHDASNQIAELTAEEIAEFEENEGDLSNNPNVKAVLTGGVVIPTGFTYVEGTKDTGVVVSVVGLNNVISEFVWVPVETPVASTEAEGTNNKAMAINLGTAEAPQYRGLLYNFTGTTTVTSEVISGCTTTEDTYREPANLSSTYDSSDKITGWDSTTYQTDYDLMIKSVIKYGGFYIGRYETSVNGETVASTIGTEDTNTRPMARVQWYELYTKQKAFSSANSLTAVQSSMVWGSQYDAMLNWVIETETDAAKIIAKNNAPHDLNETYQPGTQIADKINNIYDLEGNVREWTLEADYTYFRVMRGGYYNNAYTPSYRHINCYPTNGYAVSGSRATLYIL